MKIRRPGLWLQGRQVQQKLLLVGKLIWLSGYANLVLLVMVVVLVVLVITT